MPVQRFTLDQSQLNDADYGLSGASPAFVLDTNSLNQGVLDGTTFETVGVASAPLGGLTASGEGDVTVVIQSIGIAELGAITANAITSVTHFATGTTSASATSTATSIVTGFAVGQASLGALTATTTAAVALVASASASLGIISANAAATVTHTATAITSADLTATATATVASINAGFAPLGEITATATAVVTHPVMPASSAGVHWVQPAPRPIQQKPVVVEKKPEPVKVQKPKPVVKPKPVRVVSASASCDVEALIAEAFSRIDWIAELDDLEVLELI